MARAGLAPNCNNKLSAYTVREDDLGWGVYDPAGKLCRSGYPTKRSAVSALSNFARAPRPKVVLRQCKLCGSDFDREKRSRPYCSYSCQRSAKTYGDDHDARLLGRLWAASWEQWAELGLGEEADEMQAALSAAGALTLAEAGALMRITRERVRQLEAAAMRKAKRKNPKPVLPVETPIGSVDGKGRQRVPRDLEDFAPLDCCWDPQRNEHNAKRREMRRKGKWS